MSQTMSTIRLQPILSNSKSVSSFQYLYKSKHFETYTYNNLCNQQYYGRINNDIDNIVRETCQVNILDIKGHF